MQRQRILTGSPTCCKTSRKKWRVREERGKRQEAQGTEGKPGLPAARAPVPNSSYLATKLVLEDFFFLLQSKPRCIILEFFNYISVMEGLGRDPDTWHSYFRSKKLFSKTLESKRRSMSFSHQGNLMDTQWRAFQPVLPDKGGALAPALRCAALLGFPEGCRCFVNE